MKEMGRERERERFINSAFTKELHSEIRVGFRTKNIAPDYTPLVKSSENRVVHCRVSTVRLRYQE